MPNMKIIIDGNNKFKKLFDLEQLYFFFSLQFKQ